MFDFSHDFKVDENFGIDNQIRDDYFDLSDRYEEGVKEYLSNTPPVVYTCSDSKSQSFNYQSKSVEDSLKNVDEISNLGNVADDYTLNWDLVNDGLNLGMKQDLGVSNNLFEELYKANYPQALVNKTDFERMDFVHSPFSSNEATKIIQEENSCAIDSPAPINVTKLKKTRSVEQKWLAELNVAPEKLKKTKSAAGNKRRKPLALRADVMNKNLFRAFRRQLKCLYTAFMAEKRLYKSRNRRIFNVSLNLFSSHLLSKTNLKWEVISGFCQNEFTKYLGIFLNMCNMKKLFTEVEDMEKLDTLNDLLYGYSHKKFYDFISIPEVSTILKMILEKTTTEEFILNQETLSTNKSQYLTHLESVLSQI